MLSEKQRQYPSRVIAARLFADGFSTVEVAMELGVGKEHANKLRRQLGLPRPEPQQPEWWEGAMNMYRSDVSLKEIANYYNKAPHYINRVRRKLGIPARRGEYKRHEPGHVRFIEELYCRGYSYAQCARMASGVLNKSFSRNCIAGLVNRNQWVRGGRDGTRRDSREDQIAWAKLARAKNPRSRSQAR